MAVPGVHYRDVVGQWGEPEAFASRAPVYCLYGDLELGFTKKGRLWYLQIEPGGTSVSFPAGPGERVREPLPAFPDLVASLAEAGYRITEEPHPYEPEVVWSRVERSGVEFRQDADQGSLSVHLAAMDIHRQDDGPASG
ncbi:hypothetical protein [Streptomyces mashuensis]|uniref:hypothetical protein n=1 Tax=Streptomyces mashuensis TaxID=33904 RepID=UPI00167C6E77|nr:hypothetical protein [Streptomyces mashuensis]